MTRGKKQDGMEQQIADLTADLQRTRADFENYRKRTEAERNAAYQRGQEAAVLRLLPVIDIIDRATLHVPDALKDNPWVQGVIGLSKGLDKVLEGLNLRRIEASVGLEFNPELHEAIQFDENSEGGKEVIAEVLQAGYMLGGQPIRHTMVKVTRTNE